MDPSLEYYTKQLKEFTEMFISFSERVYERNLYDQKLMSYLVNEIQQKASAISSKLERECE